MKKLIVFLIIIFSGSILPQVTKSAGMFSTFSLEALGGINSQSFQYFGPSITIEVETNLVPDLNINFSVGYLTTYSKYQRTIRSYRTISIDNIKKYQTFSYETKNIEYDIIPISIGLQYYLQKRNFLPYFCFEIGYNSYYNKINTYNVNYNVAGSYNSYDQVPSDYKNEQPQIPENQSYRIAIGIGTKFKISKSLDFDIRYLYLFNKNIANTNQLLVGVVF